IRGEEPARLSQTLYDAKKHGMELRFLSRLDYNQKKKSSNLISWTENGIGALNETPSDSLLIPEGGACIEGVRGAEEILSLAPVAMYSHICSAVGTGTTLVGLINSARQDQKIIGVSVLKG